MSDLYLLKGDFSHLPFSGGAFARTLRRKLAIDTSHLLDLAKQIEDVLSNGSNTKAVIPDNLLAVEYFDVVPKSRRISRLFSPRFAKAIDECVVGARFITKDNKPRHMIIYYLPDDRLRFAIRCLTGIASCFEGAIENEVIEKLFEQKKASFGCEGLSCSEAAAILCDCSNISSIYVPPAVEKQTTPTILTFYDFGLDLRSLLKRVGITLTTEEAKTIMGETIALSSEHYEFLLDNAAYLVSMEGNYHTGDDLPSLKGDPFGGEAPDIGFPDGAEPIIGVFDTGFDEKSDLCQRGWVEVVNALPPGLAGLSRSVDDQKHGTAVSALIVDGPSYNADKNLDDECGRFRVVHYVVGDSAYTDVMNLLLKIREAVERRPDIHVWNLSLGSKWETKENSVSLIAETLDQLQRDRPNLLFVISGTNDPQKTMSKRVGAPADSVNSLIVNSVGFDGKPADYSRKGPILGFYRKPDVSFYGGTDDDPLHSLGPLGGLRPVSGTSFAAPWIARKAAYLIDKAGLSRNAAKALIINSCLSFAKPMEQTDIKGFGVVPVSIRQVIHGESDEIRFLFEEKTESYYTSTYTIPVPTVQARFPFKARAVMAFPSECKRNQGVDYTCEELSLQFGRMTEKDKIKPINDDIQDTPGHYTCEEDARALFRKWDNVKVVGETLKTRSHPSKMTSKTNYWGFRVAAKNRFSDTKKPVPFAGVITLKEINGQDRSATFKDLCLRNGWLVETIDVDVINKVYLQATSTITFDDGDE